MLDIKKVIQLEEAVSHLKSVQEQYIDFGEYDSYGKIISDINEHIQILNDSIDKKMIEQAQLIICNADTDKQDDKLEEQSEILQERRLLNENCEWTDKACDLMGWPHEATKTEDES